MKHIFKYIALAASALFLASCQQPDYKVSEAVATKAINSITASFIGDTSDENKFPSEIDYENHVITIVFPYTYPANSKYNLEEEDLKKVKVIANLDDNCSIEPAILVMDLTEDNLITVINQKKERTDYIVRGEIRKSAECSVTSFKLVDDQLVGVVNENARLISIISDDTPASQLAQIELSFGATITSTPDPTKVACDYSKDVTFTVTAQDGKTSSNYTVKVQLPDILEKGMRPNSAKILWNKKIVDTYAPVSPLMMTSMAVIKDYIVLNTRNEDMIVVSRKTGEKVGTITLPFKGSLTNFKATGDNSDNILVTNLSSDEVVVYRIKGIDGTPTEYIRYAAGGKSYGRGISIIGSLDEDAIITMPRYQDTWTFLRWTVKGGVLNPEPEVVNIDCSLNAGKWEYNCDIVPTSATDPKADYFVNSYAKLKASDSNDRATLWISGQTNKEICRSALSSSNWVLNAVDYVKFNGVGFLVANSVNSFTWGTDDIIYLYDLSDSNLDKVTWKSDAGIYGSMANITQANGNACGDVALRVSDNGYYMYMYFFFAGGQMVAVQFDCLDM